MRVKGPLKVFVGREFKNCADRIQEYVTARGYTMNVIQAGGSVTHFDYDNKRLTVHIDKHAVVTGFAFG